ncbi:family 20 glycosylhydrolase [Chiayiivirga flava]|uniref:beta-N-acetylhexosaminidase n=1 Tax=Chiayiivirga flava TaxID=659595 RepID=A0A7W8FZR1_9GAMM|nr:family 20 glycosylhydrolase [Chiayiivirga flava]MBB5208732.1 hexosaminidase [Chiayiivirga flava]
MQATSTNTCTLQGPATRRAASLTITLALGIALAIAGCAATDPPAASAVAGAAASAPAPTSAPLPPALIPVPSSLALRAGAFVLDGATRIHATGDATTVAAHIAAYFEHTRKFALTVSAVPTDRSIALTVTPDADANPERYTLDITPERIAIDAPTPAGLFRGAMTLWQLLPPSGPQTVPALRIEDAPRFGWRGLMLDSARHMQTVDEIKRLLDAMAQHKFNRFHWHLTDDQGWRIPIDGWPKLTDTGACRIPLGDAGRNADGTPRQYCGHYTKQQIREIVDYAAERHIEVVPEIDIPGHAQAAIAAYPELGVLDTPPAVSAEWGIHTYLFNAEESTFAFLDEVFRQAMDLFPGTYIHVGGDEAAKDQWIASERVQARIRELGLEDEHDLQAYLMARIERVLAERGRRLIGWDEILEGELPVTATVMSWRGSEGGIEAAKHGNDVVMSPYTDLYLDYLQSTSPNEIPGRPLPQVTLRKVYDYEPVPAELSADEAKHILGAQGNLWTEHLRSIERVERAYFPRAAALSEALWTADAQQDWRGFLARLPAQFARYRALGVTWSTTAFEPAIALAADPAAGRVRVTLANQVDLGEIRYTLDGSAPTPASTRYAAPFDAPIGASLVATTFVDGVAIAPAQSRALDRTSLLRRTDEGLTSCTDSLRLRLEDDGPADGERALFEVDIFNPCWLFEDAPLDGIATVEVRAAQLPYAFQLWNDEKNRRSRPKTTAHGELELRAGCEGPLLATAALPARAGADGFSTFRLPIAARPGAEDLCLYFTGDTRPTYWAIDAVQLVPAE